MTPLVVEVKVTPLSEHPPALRLHATVPVPRPPLVVSECVDPTTKEEALEITKADCVPFPMVIEVFAESVGRKESSPAFVALT